MTNTQIALVGIVISSVGIGLESITGGMLWFGICIIAMAIFRFLVAD